MNVIKSASGSRSLSIFVWRFPLIGGEIGGNGNALSSINGNSAIDGICVGEKINGGNVSLFVVVELVVALVVVVNGVVVGRTVVVNVGRGCSWVTIGKFDRTLKAS